MEHVLTGLVANNALFQRKLRRVCNPLLRFYDSPRGKAGRIFVILLTKELKGAQYCRQNSEQPMVFIGAVISNIPGVKVNKDIWARLLMIMCQWTIGSVGALVEDTCGTGMTHNGHASEIIKKDCK